MLLKVIATGPSPWKLIEKSCLATIKREKIPQEALSDVPDSLSRWQWNGTYLATLKGEKITIWEVDATGLTPRQTITNDNNIIDFAWQNNQLAVICNAQHAEGNYRLDTWEEREEKKWALNSLNLPYEGLSNLFALDGEWLAIIPTMAAGATTVDIWRKREHGVIGKSKKLDLGCPVTSVEWHGKFLFAGDSNGTIHIWNREKDSTQTIQCHGYFDSSQVEDPQEWLHSHHYVFINNFVVVTSNWEGTGSSISLLKQNQDGIFKKAVNLKYSENYLRTFLYDQESLGFVESGYGGVNVARMSFGHSYKGIFKGLSSYYSYLGEALHELVRDNPPEELQYYLDEPDVTNSRLLFRMPKSQQDKIMNKIQEILKKNRTPRAFLGREEESDTSNNMHLHLKSFDPTRHMYTNIKDVVNSHLYFEEISEAIDHFVKTYDPPPTTAPKTLHSRHDEVEDQSSPKKLKTDSPKKSG
jgi:hypothetical protein